MGRFDQAKMLLKVKNYRKSCSAKLSPSKRVGAQ